MMRLNHAVTTLLIVSCASQIDPPGQAGPSTAFNQLWSQGKAELNRFDLDQARYGEMHEGHAVMIFVKEKVSKDNHVKLDNPDHEGVEVLKCNYIRKFKTGIYDYSMMLTTMTAIEGPQYGQLLKSTMSSQDWCGHGFANLNKVKKGFSYKLDSYFEGESDTRQLDGVLTEDELFSLVRIDPNLIPVGERDIIPSQFYLRLRHIQLKAYKAEISLENEAGSVHLRIFYPELKRNVQITYKTEFPHQITGIEETYDSGWGEKEKSLISTMILKDSRWAEYWKEHDNRDSVLRKPAGLPLYSD